jgi:hypothetical protein
MFRSIAVTFEIEVIACCAFVSINTKMQHPTRKQGTQDGHEMTKQCMILFRSRLATHVVQVNIFIFSLPTFVLDMKGMS